MKWGMAQIVHTHNGKTKVIGDVYAKGKTRTEMLAVIKFLEVAVDIYNQRLDELRAHDPRNQPKESNLEWFYRELEKDGATP